MSKKETVAQHQCLFHKDVTVPGTESLPDAPTVEERRWRVNWEKNPACPLFRYVGNEPAKRKLAESAFVALKRANHAASEVAVFLSGPASVGKTTLARLFSETLDLPFVEISPRSIVNVNDLFSATCAQMVEDGLPIVAIRGSKHFRLPPCIVFVDEVHELSQKVVDALLKACEAKDGMLTTERGEIVDCRNVSWFIATTEGGDLFDAFESRFDEVPLRYYTREELAKIVHLNNPDWEMNICRLVAKFQKLPRKLLRFAVSMRAKREMYEDMSWEDIALAVATDNGIDRFGMGEKHVAILRALKAKAVAKDRLPIMIGVTKAELEKKLMPLLLTSTPDEPALVEVGSGGYSLTDVGHAELAKRK